MVEFYSTGFFFLSLEKYSMEIYSLMSTFDTQKWRKNQIYINLTVKKIVSKHCRERLNKILGRAGENNKVGFRWRVSFKIKSSYLILSKYKV